jgi:hypothetical protein
MNTLKIWDREGVGLAVPADAIARALDEAVQELDQTESPGNPDALLRACNELLVQLRNGEGTERLERLISARMAAEHGPASLAVLPTEDRQWEHRSLQCFCQLELPRDAA